MDVTPTKPGSSSSFCFRNRRRRRLHDFDHRCIQSPGHSAAAKFVPRPDRNGEASFEPSYSERRELRIGICRCVADTGVPSHKHTAPFLRSNNSRRIHIGFFTDGQVSDVLRLRGNMLPAAWRWPLPAISSPASFFCAEQATWRGTSPRSLGREAERSTRRCCQRFAPLNHPRLEAEGGLVLAICTTESYYFLSHVVSDLNPIRDTRQSTGTGYACLDSG